MNSWQSQQQSKQIRVRETNEWIEHMADAWGSTSPTVRYLCECNETDCDRTVSMTRAEYEGVRVCSVRFVVSINHEHPEYDRLIVQTNRFAIIEKLPGGMSRAARAADPRRNPFPPNEVPS